MRMAPSSSCPKTIEMLLSRRLALLTICLWSISLSGQQFYFDQFSVAEGLAQSTVHKVIQASNDLYWLGTSVGVASFNGVQFVNYSSADGLAEGGVRAICEDRSGMIWFGHKEGGITVYDGNSFKEVTALSEQINQSTISSILLDTAGHLWFTTAGAGIIKLLNPDSPSGDFLFEHYSGGELSNEVFGHYQDQKGRIYFVTNLGVVEYMEADSIRFQPLLVHGVPRYGQTTAVLVDRQDRTWIGKYHGGLYRYNPRLDSTVMYDLVKAGLKSNWISTLFEDKDGNIWAGTYEDGVVRISPENKMELFSKRNGFPGMKVWSMMQDREGNLLIGTNDNGLCVYKGDDFISYFKEDGLINSQVKAILERANGTYWFGTSEGISILSRSSASESMRDFHMLHGVEIEFLKEDKQGTVWIGTFDNGVSSYSRTGEVMFDHQLNTNISQKQVRAMAIDQDDYLWIGTLEGLIYYDIENQKLEKLFIRSLETDLNGNEIAALYVDAKNRVWVGSDGKGVTLIDGGEFFSLDLGFEFTPTAFAEDQDGMMWIGTEGMGLILYDPEQEEVRSIYNEAEDGLLANHINLVNVDRFNNIYVGTNKGLNIYARNESRFYSFTSKSGFVGIDTRPNASCADRMGDMWFGTVLGVTRYRPSRYLHIGREASTHITGMEVNHERVEMERGLSFSHRQNSITFEYGSITLNPDEVFYSIMLEGIDKEWRQPDRQTRAIYPVLPHGRYKFMVKARNSAGVWNRDPASFRFVIKPPFYLRWYFILSALLASLLLIISYVKIRERALKRENSILEEKVKDRTAIVVAQKEELTQKNKDITDSIRYAKRIQFAILPEESPFPDTFILFKPKDIVSGDFYWFNEVGNKEFFAAVDCTGHGVPGAFMSIIGHNSLTKIVREYGILEPGKILSQLNKEVLETLHQRSDMGDVYDGMDLALVSYDKKGKYLEYSGAFNPLYLVRDGEILETKADKISIGRSSFKTEAVFQNHRIEVKSGDTVYLFSDGYADQFGGERMKKFKYGNLKELILKIQPESMAQQRILFDYTIEKWRGDIEQLDDILVIGRRF
jgi:ligand-binding sensor domain-containing protein/serine phosphatase RsbU (regulator of sigma subunit)